jgi:TonB family protein
LAISEDDFRASRVPSQNGARVWAKVVDGLARSPKLPASFAKDAALPDVILTVRVEADGSISDTRIARSSVQAILDQLAAQFARARWRFCAATQSGAFRGCTSALAAPMCNRDTQRGFKQVAAVHFSRLLRQRFARLPTPLERLTNHPNVRRLPMDTAFHHPTSLPLQPRYS